jgi:SNF2 family DNA or RNA helicase
VFTQYVEMGSLIVAHLAARGTDAAFLHGATSARKREELVESFQAGDVPVFVLSLKAGGVGLNLTRATHVIHYDRWWNPAVEDQATDRAYRIGQDRPVTVHRLVAEGTVEDKIAAMLTDKRYLADAVVGTGEAWIGELSDRDLAELVSLSAVATAEPAGEDEDPSGAAGDEDTA